MDEIQWLVVFAIFWTTIGLLGAWVASQKGRSAIEGFLLGFVFSILGVLIEAMLPNKIRPKTERQPEPSVSAYLRKIDRRDDDWSS